MQRLMVIMLKSDNFGGNLFPRPTPCDVVRSTILAMILDSYL